MSPVVLDLRDLSVAYNVPGGEQTVVWGVDLALRSGAITALAGESGCGKSTTALAAVGYRNPSARVVAGESWFDGADLLALGPSELRRRWGSEIAFLAQDASAALNPALRVGTQLKETLTTHLGLRGDALRARMVELFESVGVPKAEAALHRYPHEFSGGQQQRISIALALACEPKLMIMDEPTTGLDVTTQKQISALLRRIVDETGLAALYVSHDIALLSEIADEMVVMYAGEVVEAGPMATVLDEPRHPYTQALLRSVPSASARAHLDGIPGAPPTGERLPGCAFAPRCGVAQERCSRGRIELELLSPGHSARCLLAGAMTSREIAAPRVVAPPSAERRSDVMVSVSDLVCEHGRAGSRMTAVDRVSFELGAGEAVGIVGESGSGKSTLLRAIAGLHAPSAGSVIFRDEPLAARAVERPRSVRREIQLVFQNPRSALNPRQTVLDLITRPARLILGISRAESEKLADELLTQVKLPRSLLHHHAGELSGGQQQRVALARAFSTKPALLLLDEVTSSLDVSVQATILELIRECVSFYGATVLFVSHDLAVVRALCDRALVMKDGEICEQGELEQLFTAARHEYTRSLIDAIPAFN